MVPVAGRRSSRRQLKDQIVAVVPLVHRVHSAGRVLGWEVTPD
jgi:hypothetical protein